jgi:hypothetical protein
MALQIADRVKETSTTTGTGTLTLAGAVAGFQAFGDALTDADTTYYAIVDSAAGDWEVGLGTFTASGTTLSRDTILASSNADAAVNLAAGSKDVFITYPAEKAVYADADGNTLFSAAYNNQVGTTYTIQASDNGKILTFNNAASIAVTLPDTLDTDFQCTIVQIGAGVPTVTPATDTVNGAGTGVAPVAQWKAMYLSQYAATTWLAIL